MAMVVVSGQMRRFPFIGIVSVVDLNPVDVPSPYKLNLLPKPVALMPPSGNAWSRSSLIVAEGDNQPPVVVMLAEAANWIGQTA